MVAAYLDTRNHLIGWTIAHIGTLNRAAVEPRTIFQVVLLKNTAGIILAHNYHSCDPSPSAEDLAFTRRMREAGELVGVRLVDHPVLGDDERWVSLKQQGALWAMCQSDLRVGELQGRNPTRHTRTIPVQPTTAKLPVFPQNEWAGRFSPLLRLEMSLLEIRRQRGTEKPMRLKVILVLALLLGLPSFGLAWETSPSGHRQFVLGMEYSRVKELLNKSGLEVILGEPPNWKPKDFKEKAFLSSRNSSQGNDRGLLCGGLQSEFGWPKDQIYYALVFSASGTLKQITVALFPKGRKEVETLRALNYRLISDFDRDFQRVLPWEDRELADRVTPSGASVPSWVAGDGTGGLLGVNFLEQKKDSVLMVFVQVQEDPGSNPAELNGALSAGATADVSRGEKTEPKLPLNGDPQGTEEQKPDSSALTNEDVVKLSVSGMGDDLLIQLIGSSSVSLEISTNALLELKTNGISDRVIAAMLSREKSDRLESSN